VFPLFTVFPLVNLYYCADGVTDGYHELKLLCMPQ
jgi:hypothetical protein